MKIAARAAQARPGSGPGGLPGAFRLDMSYRGPIAKDKAKRRRCSSPPAISSPTGAMRLRRDLAARGDLAGRRRPVGADGGTRAGLCLGMVRARRMREQLGDRPSAIAAFRSAHAPTRRIATARPAPRPARHRRANGRCRPHMSARLFDQYAPRFDARSKALPIGRRQLLARWRSRGLRCARQRLRFGTVLDLGCGTGLAARRSGRCRLAGRCRSVAEHGRAGTRARDSTTGWTSRISARSGGRARCRGQVSPDPRGRCLCLCRRPRAHHGGGRVAARSRWAVRLHGRDTCRRWRRSSARNCAMRTAKRTCGRRRRSRPRIAIAATGIDA